MVTTILGTLAALLLAQTPPAPAPAQAAAAPVATCTITGTLTAGKTPLPGVVIALTNGVPDAKPVNVTASNPDGTYILRVPTAGGGPP